jgi:hypothetical protein
MLKSVIIIVIANLASCLTAHAQQRHWPDTSSLRILFAGQSNGTVSKVDVLTKPFLTTNIEGAIIEAYRFGALLKGANYLGPFQIEGNRLPVIVLSEPFRLQSFDVDSVAVRVGNKRILITQNKRWFVKGMGIK